MNGLVKKDSFQIIPIIPANYEEVYKMAELICKTDMVPKDFKNNHANTVVAIQLGMEVGLYPMQALQNIAVINGRPCVWGDAQLALVRASGLMEWMKESGDNEYATCEVKRYGDPNIVSQTFRKNDAERAGLWGKSGPWKQYPKRMLQMRARSFALRDLFPDVLKGLHSREEAEDIIDIESTPVEEKKVHDITSSKEEKPNLDILKGTSEKEEKPGSADDGAEPPPLGKTNQEDIALEDQPPERISTKQFSIFLNRTKELKVSTQKLLAFVKKNGFENVEHITTDKFDLMLEGLEEI